LIAKAARRIAGGSFSRLAAYVSDLKKIGDLRDWKKTADYILDAKGAGERVDAIRVTNCANEEPGLALAEIANTQARNTTSKADKTYHLIVSFPPGEQPTEAQLGDIEETLCAAIGLADHQRLSAVHNDKDHFHFHVAINKVHPRTLRTVTPYFDHPRLQAACAELEKKHGLTPTNHQMPEQGKAGPKGRAEAMETHGRQQSLIQWVRDEAGAALLKARRAEARKQDAGRALPTWQSWLQEQAARGNTQAAEVLRSGDQRQAELGAAILSAENAEQARHVVYQHLRPVVGKDGAITYRVADGGRVTDQARQVRVDEMSVAATFLALSLAADRFGNRPLVIGGTDAFKAQLTTLAAVEGMNVTFADPAMEAERQRQVKEHQASRPTTPAAGQTQADPELAAFIEKRNAARATVPGILPHRAWEPSDAGEAVYRGRRQLGERREVLLFDRDGGETLVKDATPAQAAHASILRIGDTVEVDARGRLHEHRAQQEKPGGMEL
jgi:hypothetical protein